MTVIFLNKFVEKSFWTVLHVKTKYWDKKCQNWFLLQQIRLKICQIEELRSSILNTLCWVVDTAAAESKRVCLVKAASIQVIRIFLLSAKHATVVSIPNILSRRHIFSLLEKNWKKTLGQHQHRHKYPNCSQQDTGHNVYCPVKSNLKRKWSLSATLVTL